MPPINVRDANGDVRELEVPNPNGRQNAAGSRPVALSTEDKAALDDIAEAIGNLAPGDGSGGDASAANQVTMIGVLEAIDGRLAGSIDVVFDFPDVQPVSAASLPLPAGAATAEGQDAAKASLDKLSSAKSWFAIEPADAVLSIIPDAIYVGGDGDLVLRGDDDEDATFAVVAGQILPVSPAQVRAATTATGLVGLVA